MAQKPTADDEGDDDWTATVSEDKFNASATYTVTGTGDKQVAKRTAKRFFREEYGHRPSRVVAEQDDAINGRRWTVMVADSSSGSLKDSRTISLRGDD